MPALIMFGRRWRIASDDFFFRGIATVIHRLSWIVTMKIVESSTSSIENCDIPNANIYAKLAFWLFLLMAIQATFVLALSTRGTITCPGHREHLPNVLYVSVFLAACDLALHLFGISAVFITTSKNCLASEYLRIIFLKFQVIYFLLLNSTKIFMTVLLLYDPLGATSNNYMNIENQEHNEGYSRREATKSIKIWRLRFMLLCGCCSSDQNLKDAFDETSELFSTFFKDVDLTPSDVLAGLILLYEHRWTDSLRNFQAPDAESGNTNDPSHQNLPLLPPPLTCPPDWMTIDTAFHFIKYALAIYGWPLFAVTNNCCGINKLLPNLRPMSFCSHMPSNYTVLYDNICGCHIAALRETAGLEENDLLLASFKNNLYEVPFVVAIDHAQKAIVISIRGTMSLGDALTDLQANAKDVSCPDLPPGCSAHAGILSAARFVEKQLHDTNVLDSALQSNQGYDLVIIGHSLGAGTASVLGLLLRSKYQNVRCILYAPPGGLLSENAASISEEFQMSVIVGTDLVPRLGVATGEALKNKLLTALERSTIPKYRLLSGELWDTIINLFTSSKRMSNYNFQRFYEPAPPLQPTNLYLPGRILHIIDFSNDYKSGNFIDLHAYWRKPEDFLEILVAPRMLSDHLPQAVYKALQKLAECRANIRNPHRYSNTINEQPPGHSNCLIDVTIEESEAGAFVV